MLSSTTFQQIWLKFNCWLKVKSTKRNISVVEQLPHQKYELNNIGESRKGVTKLFSAWFQTKKTIFRETIIRSKTPEPHGTRVCILTRFISSLSAVDQRTDDNNVNHSPFQKSHSDVSPDITDPSHANNLRLHHHHTEHYHAKNHRGEHDQQSTSTDPRRLRPSSATSCGPVVLLKSETVPQEGAHAQGAGPPRPRPLGHAHSHPQPGWHRSRY